MSLSVDRLHAGYNSVPVLNDVTLKVEEGVVCALMGRNGSGKTTLLRCINAILKPVRGEVTVCGKDVFRLPRIEIARLVSLVPQGIQVVFSFSVLEMVLMGSAPRIHAWSAPTKKDARKALEILDELEIGALAHRPFNQLSGGERQLVMLARALYQDTPVMLLDEPNAHLDFSNQHRMMALMRNVVKKRGVTALISLHDPNLCLHYCDQAVLLGEGRVIASGPRDEVMNDGLLERALGANIRRDITARGIHVVTPRTIVS